MKKSHWLSRLLLSGFVAIFVFAFAYLLLDSFGIWASLPVGFTHSLEVLTGLILLGELIGHLILTTGELSTGPSGRG